MKLGVHVSIAGNLINSLDRAKSVGCETMQIFTSNPKGWDFKIRPEEEITEFCTKTKEYNIDPIFGHMIYLTNLASDNPYIYTNSINSLISGLVLADAACFAGVITHVGSHGGRGDEAGIKQVVNALKQSLATTKEKVPIILETDAGSGNHLGFRFEEIAEISKRVGSEKIKVCLDTCHIFAAGYDIRTEKGIEEALGNFDQTIGLDRLSVLHLNDSKADLESRVDRHEEIGKGKIGVEAFKYIVNHPKLTHLPGIVETPDNKDSVQTEKSSLDTLKELRAQRPEIRGTK